MPNMNDYTAGKAWKKERQQIIIEAGYHLFSQRGIEQVLMVEVAKAAGVGHATLNRYFHSKLELVVAASEWAWDQYITAHNHSVLKEELDRLKGCEYMRFFMESFIDLYRNHKDLLRFNYNFNNYFRYAAGNEAQAHPMMEIVRKLEEQFHIAYERGMRDGTLNPEISEETMFSSLFHIMLAAVTRYAVGLVYIPEGSSDPESELIMLKELLLSRYVKQC